MEKQRTKIYIIYRKEIAEWQTYSLLLIRLDENKLKFLIKRYWKRIFFKNHEPTILHLQETL